MNEIKMNPDGPDEHGSFTHPQVCMCHDCLPGSNRLPTTGETCPVCDDSGGVDSGGITPWGAPITLPCPSCVEDTVFKRAVETEHPKLVPCSTVVSVGAQCSVCGKAYENHHDENHIWHTTDGNPNAVIVKTPSPAAEVKDRKVTPSEIEEVAKQIFCIMHPYRLPSDYEPKYNSIAQWHLSDLTTKLAALKEEIEFLKGQLSSLANNMVYRGNSVSYIYAKTDAYLKIISDCFTVLPPEHQPDGKKSIVDLIKEMAEQLTTLRAENQGLVNEVEKLRIAIQNCISSNWELCAKQQLRQALKPTPEESGSKRNP